MQVQFGESIERSASTVDRGIRDVSPCVKCAVRESSFCGSLLINGRKDDSAHGRALTQAFQTTDRRRNIYDARTKSDDMYIICTGWAFRFMQLPDGRRQILSILLPGDLISTIGLFMEYFSFSVQALTEVRHCRFSRAELQEKLSASSDVFDSFVKECIAEKERADGALADLGRRSAEERISRFILQLMERLSVRGMAAAQSFAFPLRQHHIADAVGLTTVHVSRVIGKFREIGLLEIEKGILKVFKLAELRRIANMK